MKVTKAIIPAAGFGTRMLPATKSIPKEMLPLGDKPAIQHIVEEAVSSGITDILIITSRTKISMEDHFDYSPELEAKLKEAGKDELAREMRAIADLANITFLRQREMLGLGHAVWCGRRFTGSDPFAVLLGDDIMRSETPVTLQLINASEKYGACSVGVQSVSEEMITKYCSLEVSKLEANHMLVSDLIEKPRKDQIRSLYAILGRYVLDQRVMDLLETLPAGAGGEIQLTDALNAYCKTERLVAVDFEGKRYDCGNNQGYLEAAVDFALHDDKTSEFMRKHIKKLAQSL